MGECHCLCDTVLYTDVLRNDRIRKATTFPIALAAWRKHLCFRCLLPTFVGNQTATTMPPLAQMVTQHHDGDASTNIKIPRRLYNRTSCRLTENNSNSRLLRQLQGNVIQDARKDSQQQIKPGRRAATHVMLRLANPLLGNRFTPRWSVHD